MYCTQLSKLIPVALGLIGWTIIGPDTGAQSVTAPVKIGSSTANYHPTLGIPRWKAYMRETNPDQFWVCYANGSRTLSNISYTTDGGDTWSSDPIQIDPEGYLDMHLSVFGQNGNLYTTFPGRGGVKFRKFDSPVHSNADGGPVVSIAGTDAHNRSNIMVQDGGRIWLFTRRSYDSPSENVLFNYSDDDGDSWTHGTAFATNSTSVRFGSMPYVGGRPALIVLYLADDRGFEYYLWDGTKFVAEPDHSIYADNMGQTRAFTHNVVNDSTFHLVFGLGNELHHVWKNFNNGTGAWNSEVIETSSTTEDMDWRPTSTVRGDDLYLFYARKSTTSEASSMIYYRIWSQSAQTWSDPTLVSTEPGSSYNQDPNTCFQVPASSVYVPVIWSSGSGPFDINFAKIVVGERPAVAIDCPSGTLTRSVCGAGEVCLPVAVSNAVEVTVPEPWGSWQNDTLCLTVDTAGTYAATVIAVNAGDTARCSVEVQVEVGVSADISCPPDTFEFASCRPTTFSIPLPISGQSQVSVSDATWAGDSLVFYADTTGIYTFDVTAQSDCGADSCRVVASVDIGPNADLYLSDTDLSVSDSLVSPGDTIEISAIIHSSEWSVSVTSIPVRFYDGDPTAGGTTIGMDQIIPELSGGSSDTVALTYVVSGSLPKTIWVVLDPDDVIPECDNNNNVGSVEIDGQTGVGSIFGSVLFSTNSSPMAGVEVRLLDGDGYELGSSYSDASGNFGFQSVPAGDYYIDIIMPVGFGPDGPSTVPVTVGGATAEVDFSLRDLSNGDLADYWWWKRQIDGIHDGDVLAAGITRDSIDTYGQAIFEHFYDRSDGHEIRIDGVTYTGSPAHALTSEDMYTQWFIDDGGTFASKARKYYLACLLDIVSARLSQRRVASADGATVSQALAYIGDQYLHNDPDDPQLQANLQRIFSGDLIPAGFVPLSTSNIMFKPENTGADLSVPGTVELSQNYPNPFNPTTTIAYSLPARSRVRIEVFNVLGRSVRTLVDQEQAAGSYEVVWDGRNDQGESAGSGVYLYRIVTDHFSQGRKMLLLK